MEIYCGLDLAIVAYEEYSQFNKEKDKIIIVVHFESAGVSHFPSGG